MNLESILDRFEGVTRTPDGARSRCAGCGGKSQKVSFRSVDDRILVHCFGGCDVHEVLTAAGLSVTDLFTERPIDHHRSASRSSIPAREALALIDHEILVALLILNDAIKSRTVDDRQLARLSTAVQRIGAARDISAPAKVAKEAARARA